MYQNVLKWKFWHFALSKLNFGVFWKPKIAKDFLHEFGTTFLNGLCLKLEKRPSKGQKRTLTWNCLSISQLNIFRKLQQFDQIWSKLPFERDIFAPGNLEMAKYTWIYIKSGQKIPILTCNTFVDTFLPRALHYVDSWGGRVLLNDNFTT